MRRSPLALPVVLAVLAAGCGTGTTSSSSDFEGEEQKVADTVEKLQSAGETGDGAAICDEVIADELREAIAEAGSTCDSELDTAIKDADDFELDVEDVTIDGATATAKVRARTGGTEQVREFEFVREGADWRATTLGS